MKELEQASQLITYLRRLRNKKGNSLLRNRVLDNKLSEAQSLLVVLAVKITPNFVLCGENDLEKV